MIQFTRLFSRNCLNQNDIIKFICLTGTTAVTIKNLSSDSLAKSSEQLVSVHLFSRHGARTPLYLVNGIEEAHYKAELLEPYVKAKYSLKTLDNQDFKDYMSKYDQLNFNNKLKGGAGRGQLTKVGEQQMFELGRRVRDRYINELNFLNSKYNPSEHYTRSSHFRRTINSARCFLAGVYNNSNNDVGESFLINVSDLENDYIFPNAIDCSYYHDMHTFITKLDLFSKDAKFIKHLNELNQKIFKGNRDEKSWISFTKFRDDMIARQIHGEEVPSHLENEFEKSHHFASKELTAMSTHNLKITCGRLLGHIKKNLLETVCKDAQNKDTSDKKFRHFSAHDTTLNALLNAFKLIDSENEQWPPFAADLAIELWKELDETTNKYQYYVKLFYCSKAVKLKNCDSEKCSLMDSEKCTLMDFIDLLKKNEVNEDHYRHLCSQTFVG